MNFILGSLLLTVLFAPLLAAACLAILRPAKAGTARTIAVWTSAFHVLLTVALFVLYSGHVNQDNSLSLGFQPKVVPGDPGSMSDSDVITYKTNWTLLSLSPDGVSAPTVQFFVGLDGLNLLLIGLTSLMFFFAVLVSWGTITERAAPFYAWLFVLQSCVNGAFASFDIILFYVFFELTLIPSFFLIGQWGTGGARRDAAKKFVLYTLLGSLLTLIGIIGIVLTNPIPVHPTTNKPFYFEPTPRAMTTVENEGNTYVNGKTGPITFSIPILMKNVSMWDSMEYYSVGHAENRLARATPAGRATAESELATAQQNLAQRRSMQFWIFLALMAGFAVKIPIVPFHTWLPSAYGEAPIAVTMIFSAILAKLGTFGIIRIVIPLLPEMCVLYGLPLFGTLGAIGIVYAAFCAYAQRDLKMLAAYSSVSHLGFLVIGLFSLSREGLSGAALHMVNHGLTAGALFALLAFLSRRYRTLDATQYSGMWAKYPRFSFYFLIIALASVGLPGLCNFVSEMLMLAGLFDPRNVVIFGRGLAIVAAVGVFLASWYTFTMIRRVLFGPVVEPPALNDGAAITGDVHAREVIPLMAMSALCIGIGLFPQPLLDVLQTDTRRLAGIVDRARYRLDPQAIPIPEPAPERPVRRGPVENALREEAPFQPGGVPNVVIPPQPKNPLPSNPK